MKNASYCVSYGKEGRLQQNEQKNSFCYSPKPGHGNWPARGRAAVSGWWLVGRDSLMFDV